MVRKTLVVFVMVLLVMLSGCISTPTVSPIVPSQPITETPQIVQPATEYRTSGAIALVDSGKITVGNFRPGARAEFYLKVYNGKSVDTEVGISYMRPQHTDDGYIVAPDYVSQWVEGEGIYSVKAGETKEIFTAIEMPKDAERFADKWEFWLGVNDMGQKGTVQTGLASRYLINMRK